MSVTLEIKGLDAVERARVLLNGVPGGIDKAVKAAMSRAVQRTRSGSDKAVREKFDISSLSNDKKVTVRYTYQNGVSATITFSGRKIPLYRFGGSSPKAPTPDIAAGKKPVMVHGNWTMQYQGVPATGHQFTDTSPTLFMNAFVARMKTGHIGIFERNGGATSEGSDAIQEIMGDSYAQMVGKEEVTEKLSDEAGKTFEKELDSAVYRILTGWR